VTAAPTLAVLDRPSPFDVMAADYDRSFGASAIGRRMRAATWRRLDAAFRPGERVLELNCGTGEDALHLAERGVRVLATDSSVQMLEMTRAKVARAGLGGLVEIAPLAIEQLAHTVAGRFDGVLSNFGGVNCVSDLPAVARALTALLRPGARALLCVMGPVVPWEWAWYLAHGEPGKAARRLSRGGAPWRGLTIRYPSIGETRRAFAPHFAQRRVAAIGALLPPTYAEAWAARHPRLLAALDRCERRLETVPPLPWLADHYLLELERLA
jgi:SAM-dependent methyltransferase